MKKGIFLHFMDKQLRISLKPFVSDDDCVKLILYALIMSDRIYTLVTHIIESAEELPQTVKLLLELERLNLVTVISNYDTIEDLIIGRQELYYYDKEEYPCYYREESTVDNLYNCLIFKDSTTKIIESKLGGMHKRVENIGDCRTINDYLNYVVTQKLNDYHGEGLTIKSFENNLYDLLRGGVENRKVRLIGKRLDRELIYLHQSNYLHKTYSSIICNFPGLTFYDDLDKDKTFDFIIYCSILQPFWKSNGIENLKIKIIQWKTRRELHSVTNLLADVIEELHGKYILLFQKYDYKVAIQMIAGIITDNRNSLNLHKTGFENAEELENYITYLCKKTKIYVDKNGAEKEQMRILLPVANMTEFESIMNVAEKLSIELKRIVKGNNTYHICENEDKIIAIVKCEAGTLGAASSLLTVTDAIFALDIHTVIFSGIAFGNYLKKGKD